MRCILVFLVLAVSAANLYAIDVPEKEKTPDKATPQTRQEKTPSGQERTPAPAAPVKTYTPTEKIKADSAVSFPVDI